MKNAKSTSVMIDDVNVNVLLYSGYISVRSDSTP